MVTLALDGPASYRDRHELLLRRRAARPNQVWQADHTMLDITVLDEAGKPVRPWLTIVLDDHSALSADTSSPPRAPSAANTALALRQAIWPKTEADWPQRGLPDVLYTDHSSDFTSHRIGDTLNALHIRIIHSAVGRPQGRGKIERFFGTINTELLARLPGHITPRTTPTPKLTLSEIDATVGGFVRAYNARPHRELRESPNTAWTAEGCLPRLPNTLEELAGLLLTVPTTRTVQRDGIDFQGLRYTAPTLAPYDGAAVTIRYDPRDITEIRVLHHNQFLCTAIDVDHSRETISPRRHPSRPHCPPPPPPRPDPRTHHHRRHRPGRWTGRHQSRNAATADRGGPAEVAFLPGGVMTEHFIATPGHRRPMEFAAASRKQRAIGICFGPVGVGKTGSARRYARWDAVSLVTDSWGPASRTRRLPVLVFPLRAKDADGWCARPMLAGRKTASIA